MREGFRAIVNGWTLIDDVDHLARRCDDVAEWMRTNKPLESDERSTATAMLNALFGRIFYAGAPAITCPRCLKTSHNPHDVEHQYCGFCHRFLNDEH